MFTLSTQRLTRLSSFLLLAGVLSGCTMAPSYERPSLPVNDSYATKQETTGQEQAATELGWRQFFPDQRLQLLIATALENNRDLRIAALNIEEARAQHSITRSELLPNASIGGGMTQGRIYPANGSVSKSYQVGANLAAYELDFFGRVRSLNNAALASYLATEEAQRTAHISLISQVAQTYLAERSYTEQLELAQKTLASREQNYELSKKRFEVGASSELDLRLAETLMQAARIAVATLQRMQAQTANALDVLVGKQVTDLPPALSLSEQNIVADIPAGLPSDLLTRRPDILAAEQRLQAANANIGAARAAFFPRISMTAGIGTASDSMDGLFNAGSRTWSFIPQLTLPIFQGGRNTANLDISHARKNIAVATYEKTIQNAFREVSDALVARQTLEEQVAAQEALLTAQESRLKLSDMRNKSGIASSIELLDAQREVFSAQQALIQARQLRFGNAIDLYRSLGGGLVENSDTTKSEKPE